MINALFHAYHDHAFLLKIDNLNYYNGTIVAHYDYLHGHEYYSSIAAVIVNQHATLAEKQNLIKKLLEFNISAKSAQPFADLEFHERKCELKNKLYHLIGAAYKDQANPFALLPAELIQYICQLITDTEKPLL